jgi:hypothetical protein
MCGSEDDPQTPNIKIGFMSRPPAKRRDFVDLQLVGGRFIQVRPV